MFADQAIQSDPTSSIKPGEATVLKHIVPRAKKTIIHLYIVHPFDKKLDLKEIPFAKSVALETYRLAEKILQSTKMGNFYGDGLSANNASDLASSFSSKRPFFSIPEELKVNAMFMLLYTGVKISGVESAEEIQKFIAQLQNAEAKGPVSSVQRSELAHGREQAILLNLAKEDSGVHLLMLGAEHRLLPEVQSWNKNHPQQKFSLIEVIPKSLPKTLGEIDSWIGKNFPYYDR